MASKTYREFSADTAPARTRIVPTQAPTGSDEPTKSTVAQLLAMAMVADLSDASANGRSLISAANYAAQRALLDLEPGVDFRPPDAGAGSYSSRNWQCSAHTVTASATTATVANRAYWIPYYPTRRFTPAYVGIEQTAYTSDCGVKVAIYDVAAGVIGNLAKDCGVVTLTTGNGIKELAMSAFTFEWKPYAIFAKFENTGGTHRVLGAVSPNFLGVTANSAPRVAGIETLTYANAVPAAGTALSSLTHSATPPVVLFSE